MDERLLENQLQMMQSLGAIEAHLRDMNGDLASIKAEVGSIPDAASRDGRETLGRRLHRLENDSAAAVAAKAALTAAEASREQLTASKRQAWSWKQKNALFAVAIVTATSTLLRLFGIGG